MSIRIIREPEFVGLPYNLRCGLLEETDDQTGVVVTKIMHPIVCPICQDKLLAMVSNVTVRYSEITDAGQIGQTIGEDVNIDPGRVRYICKKVLTGECMFRFDAMDGSINSPVGHGWVPDSSLDESRPDNEAEDN
jgi:cell division FtsZ-interacting protein ZapD